MPTKKTSTTVTETISLIPDDQHPDYQGYVYDDTQALTPLPGGPPGNPFPPIPEPGPIFPPGNPIPGLPFPWPPNRPEPFPNNGPVFPINICSAVSGRYVLKQVPLPPSLPPIGLQPAINTPLFNLTRITVRVDVDRFFPQSRISVEVVRLLPRASAHIIAEVTSDQCLGFNKRRVEATVTYREGTNSLIPGDKLVFTASRSGRGIGYGNYKLTVSGTGTTTRKYDLEFKSQYFDSVEFEVDAVSNAGAVVTSHGTHTHPNRPATLANETISLETVYKRAGFDVTMSPNANEIPISGAGADGTWSDSEMHNAMITHWSRFADNPQWAMWVLYAAQHDSGRSLGGIMFDDIGPNHRQGTAIFTDSFIQDVPDGDGNPAAWRNRMVFWTAIHEMGHAFNLAHSWQKALGAPIGNPWIPLVNQPEALSFMNYPFRVSGGESTFFSNFAFRFTNDELIFMRHAPRRFVQMGNSNWFSNHAFESPNSHMFSGRYALALRPNREINTYSFLEPVSVELKLTNTSKQAILLDEHLLQDGGHIVLFVQREGGLVKKWSPMIVRCHEKHEQAVAGGQSIYGLHIVSASTGGWLIDEPGFYNIQAAVDMGDEVIISNVLRIFVAPSVKQDENNLAPDYFTEDVGRALVFDGAPELTGATNTLREVASKLQGNPAALHATKALSTPMLKPYKHLEEKKGGLVIAATKADVTEANKLQVEALLKAPEAAADTFGHINYFNAVGNLAESLKDAGNTAQAKKALESSVATMKRRKVLPQVVKDTETQLANI